MTSEAFLEEVIRRFFNLRDRAERALEGLTEEQLNQAIPGFHWTLAQVIEHVLLSHGAYIALIEQGLDRPPMAANAPAVFSFVGRIIAKKAGPGGNTPVPSVARPDMEKRYPVEIAHEILDQTEALAELARKCVGVDIGSVRVTNPVFGFLKLTLADCFQIPERHLEHHVSQLEKYSPAVRTP